MVHDYENKLSDEVDTYIAELMSVKERLEKSQMKVHKWLRDSHITEQLQQRDEMTAELERNMDGHITRFKHTISRPKLYFHSKC